MCQKPVTYEVEIESYGVAKIYFKRRFSLPDWKVPGDPFILDFVDKIVKAENIKYIRPRKITRIDDGIKYVYNYK
jgi:hypothetical protein